MSRLAAERSNCWPLVSTIRTGIVGVKPIAVNRAQHAVPAEKRAGLHIRGLEQGGQQICRCDVMCADRSAAQTFQTQSHRPRAPREPGLDFLGASPVAAARAVAAAAAVSCAAVAALAGGALPSSDAPPVSATGPLTKRAAFAGTAAGATPSPCRVVRTGPCAGLVCRDLSSMHHSLFASAPGTIACGRFVSGLTWWVSTRVGALVSIASTHCTNRCECSSSKQMDRVLQLSARLYWGLGQRGAQGACDSHEQPNVTTYRHHGCLKTMAVTA
jgi:hypothetical protein